MSTADYDRLVELIRHEPQEIRVLCPRGHFIAHVAIYVPDGQAGLWIHPRGSGKVYGPRWDSSVHGFRIDTASVERTLRVHADCQNRRCNYHAAMNFHVLARTLAAASIGGHAELRLAN